MNLQEINGICATFVRFAILVAVCALGATPAAARPKLEAVRERGDVICGVSEGATGYSTKDAKGDWHGMGVEFCRALAAAVFGSKSAVRFVPLPRDKRAAALRNDDVDLLASDINLTSTTDTVAGLRFAAAFAYDGQGFVVRRSHGVTSALELSGTRLCLASNSGDEQGVLDYFSALKIPVEVVKVERWSDAVQAYEQKSCQALSGSMTRLAAARAQFPTPADHVLLPEMAARFAIGPVVRQGDEQWFSIVRWVAFALLSAENLGVTSANADQLEASPNPEVRRFLSGNSDLCQVLGLAPGWSQKTIKLVGNYGEIYERTLGLKSPLRMPRKLNNLAGKGGLHFAPSFR